MKLNSMMTVFRGAALSGALALCFMFAGSAKAECGLSYNTRNTISPDAVKGGGAQAQFAARAQALKPDLTITLGDAKDPITGLWFATFKSGGQIVDQGFDSWSSDGTEILNDNPPPASGNVCLGTWVKTGANAYKLYHPSWTFDGGGNVNGTAIIRETVTLSADRQSYTATYTIDVLALSGATLQHFDGTISATRITVD